MKATEFLQMMREDTAAEKAPQIKAIVGVMEVVINNNSDCDIDQQKTASDCYQKMFEKAKELAKKETQGLVKGSGYCFDTDASIAFVAEYLGVSVNSVKQPKTQPAAVKGAVNLLDFF